LSDPPLVRATGSPSSANRRRGTSRSPWANPGPAATVADGADRLWNRAGEPHAPKSVAHRDGRHGIAPLSPALFLSIEHRRFFITVPTRVPLARRIRRPDYSHLAMGSQYTTHTQSTLSWRASVKPTPHKRSVFFVGPPAFPQCDRAANVAVEPIYVTCRHETAVASDFINPGCKTVGDRRW
jgi:hypothetical protein